MAKVIIVAEHRRGEIRDATFELITLARKLNDRFGLEPAVLLLGKDVAGFAEKLARYVPEVVKVENTALENFQYPPYSRVLADFFEKEDPLVTLCPHSAFGMELFPRLAVETGRPCATDVVDVEFEGEELICVRSVYNGKINSRLAFAGSAGYLLTVRTGSCEAAEEAASKGDVREFPYPDLPGSFESEFVEYREAPAGAVDITQAPVLIAVGRGIKDEDNVSKAQELAEAMGAVLACSRPVVDKKWLGKERQVGTSGSTVKPRVYIAMGISGAFQHTAGIKGAGVFIAVNRDPKAPIFRVADYGVVEDIFKVMEAMRERLTG